MIILITIVVRLLRSEGCSDQIEKRRSQRRLRTPQTLHQRSARVSDPS